ncbi:hypothetical protein ENUP19_0105G0011 [Entamoeba nuttalli]|uniref:Uncharacterized protein n=1 Tax=Entamoeba nuttalli TaxID=412467 RepID=A0ABQ0DHP0_9EUKA
MLSGLGNSIQIQYGNPTYACGEMFCDCTTFIQQNGVIVSQNILSTSTLTSPCLIQDDYYQNIPNINQYNNLKSKERELTKRAYTVGFLAWCLSMYGCEVKAEKSRKRSTKINPFNIECVTYQGEVIFNLKMFKARIGANIKNQTLINAMNLELVSLLEQFGCKINYKTRKHCTYPLITITSYSVQGITYYDWEINGKMYYEAIKQQI